MIPPARQTQEAPIFDEDSDDDIPAPEGLDDLVTVQDLKDRLGSAAGSSASPPPPPPPPPPPMFDPSLAIFLPDVPPDVDRNMLVELFAAFGRARCFRHPAKSWARVSFEREDLVEHLISAKFLTLPDGRALRLKRFEHQNSKDSHKEVRQSTGLETYAVDFLLKARAFVSSTSTPNGLRTIPRSLVDDWSVDSSSSDPPNHIELDAFLGTEPVESEEEQVEVPATILKNRWGRILAPIPQGNN